jgi:hypothetical protein
VEEQGEFGGAGGPVLDLGAAARIHIIVDRSRYRWFEGGEERRRRSCDAGQVPAAGCWVRQQGVYDGPAL